MDAQAVKQVATLSLKALSDNRVMVPADGSDALADLKTILRGLVTGALIIEDAKKPDAAE